MKKIGIMMMMLLIASFAGMAQSGGQQRNFDPEEMAKTQTAQIKEKCKLDAAQEKKVHDLLLTNGKKIQVEREKMMAAGGPPSDEMRAKMQKIRDEQNAEMKKILTAEQYVQYEKYLEERRAQRQQGGGGPR
jgi:biopolymer transport protein ExbB/TolQ